MAISRSQMPQQIKKAPENESGQQKEAEDQLQETSRFFGASALC